MSLMSGKILVVSASLLVAVVMGMSAVAPMIPPAEADHGGPDPSPAVCEKLTEALRAFRIEPPEGFLNLIGHCLA